VGLCLRLEAVEVELTWHLPWCKSFGIQLWLWNHLRMMMTLTGKKRCKTLWYDWLYGRYFLHFHGAIRITDSRVLLALNLILFNHMHYFNECITSYNVVDFIWIIVCCLLEHVLWCFATESVSDDQEVWCSDISARLTSEAYGSEVGRQYPSLGLGNSFCFKLKLVGRDGKESNHRFNCGSVLDSAYSPYMHLISGHGIWERFKKLSWMNLVGFDWNVHNWNVAGTESLFELVCAIAQRIGDGNFRTEPPRIMVSCALSCDLSD
jgi:hypothetical protein